MLTAVSLVRHAGVVTSDSEMKLRKEEMYLVNG